MWQRGEQKGDISSPFAGRAVGEKGSAGFENGGFLDRESATSL